MHKAIKADKASNRNGTEMYFAMYKTSKSQEERRPHRSGMTRQKSKSSPVTAIKKT
jgi:hypothetical protein